METITRKSLIYKSGLGFYCINHVQGCSHGCLYPCYAFQMAKQYGRVLSYDEWCAPKLVANSLDLLDKELPKFRKKADACSGTEDFRIHLSLSTDPFMVGYPEVQTMSIRIAERINSFSMTCDILTKGVLPEELSGSTFSRNNQYGISIVSLDENFRQIWEPGASPYKDRIKALRYLHDKGFYVYAHIEPYPTPNIFEQDFSELLESLSFVNSIYFGGWNYNSTSEKYPDRVQFYAEKTELLKNFCSKNKIDCTTN